MRNSGEYVDTENHQKRCIGGKIAGMYKERYFISESIQTKSQELLASVEEARRRHADIVFRPAEAALLLLDLQEYFLQESSHAFIPSAQAILPGIFRLAEAFSDAGRPVIATRHINTYENAGMMAKWWHDLIRSKIAYSQYNTTITNKKIKTLKKTQYDAFHNTPLEKKLRQRNTTQVIICGVMTHLCCETTARAAFMRGFAVFFTVDGTATYNEELHRASLLTLAHGFAVPVLIDELLEKMKSDEA